MKSVAFHTLGCKVNQYETEALKELFLQDGYTITEFSDRADVYVINTCTVTNIAAKKSRQIISRAKKNNENAFVVVVGCYVQEKPEEAAAIEGVNLIIGTDQRNQIIDLIEEQQHNEGGVSVDTVNDIKRVKTYEELKVHHNYGKTRAYIKIQDGCNQFCSYCIIPYTRGPIRSRQPEHIVEEIKALVANGYKEVVLTGIHLGSYGKDLKNISLLDIIKLVNDIDGLQRIRLGSLEPTMITDEFVLAIKELDKLCPHFHLSLQSGCDKTLAEMNRKYTTEEYLQGVERLRQHLGPVALTTDIIVGFPGETDEDFAQTLGFVEKIGFSEIHVFKYSPREGTKAAQRNDQVDGTVKEKRSHTMIASAQQMSMDYLEQFVGITKDVLVEKKLMKDGSYEGYTDNYIRVHIEEASEHVKNTMISHTLKGVEKDRMGYYMV